MPCLICWHFFRFLFFAIPRNAGTERLFRLANFTLVLKRAVFACLLTVIIVSVLVFSKGSIQNDSISRFAELFW